MRIPLIIGPTATGKTAMAEELCRKYDGEIISADTGTFYRGMDIGTGKTTLSDDITYHLVDILDPPERYTSIQFATDSRDIIDKITKKGKLPIICGGSMHYIHTLVDGLDPSPPPDEELRKSLRKEARNNPPGHLYSMLMDLDPELSSMVDPNNIKRIIRYIEKTLNETSGDPLPPLNLEHMIFFTSCSRELQEHNVRGRTRKMLDSGWIDEVRKLSLSGHLSKDRPVDPIGYNEIMVFLEDNGSRKELEELIVRKTIELSRKQSRWRRRFDAADIDITCGLDHAVSTICTMLEVHPAV
ncbi:MAG: tRNA (adenosine(37)-N6)-dimethylallyltransferase MiaA [Thermoplasmatota archaeon]